MLENKPYQNQLPLEAQFQKANFIKEIEEAKDIKKLKEVAIELLDHYYHSREFIKQLMLKDLPRLPRN